MRLPVVPQLSTKDGISNKNARLINVLKEAGAGGDVGALRPGLQSVATTTGVGRGITNFNDDLIGVYGTTLTVGTSFVSLTTVTGDFFDFAQSTI